MRTYLTALMLVTTLGLVSCGGGNETSSTGASVTAQATTATVLACNASASFGGAGPLLTGTTNPTLEACNAAITFTCNASTTFGGTEPALTATTSPSIKTCLAVMNESNPNNPSGSKVLAGQATIWTPYSNGGCGNSVSVNLFANGPPITNAQVDACVNAAFVAQTLAQCNALGGSFSAQVINYGSCEVQNGPDYYNPVPPPPTY
jgi:hypothetical protein